VKRVVITSSFASIVDGKKGNLIPDHTYSEKDWNPVTEEEAVQSPSNGYRASKTFAEKAAWDFVEKEKPNFRYSAFTFNQNTSNSPKHLDDVSTLSSWPDCSLSELSRCTQYFKPASSQSHHWSMQG